MNQIFISKNNSIYTPLAANQVWVGTSDILTSFSEIDINVYGSPTVAPATLYFEFSVDGYNWDISVPLVLTGPIIVPVTLRSISLYFRVRYVNGNVPLTSFRLITTLHRATAMRLTRFLNQTLDENEPIEVVRIAKSILPDGAATDASITSVQPREITDGYNGPVAVKPPNQAAVSSDSALVVAISPNNPITTSTARPSTSITSSVIGSVTNVTLLSSNSIRLGATVYNDSTSLLYIKLGSVASNTDFTIKIFPLGYYEVPYGYTGQIDGIWSSANGNARIDELLP